jgi:hypothetical protein
MTESMILNENESYALSTIISGYFVGADQKAVHIRLQSGRSFWVPKDYIDPNFRNEKKFLQDFTIDRWILKKIGFDISKVCREKNL